MKIELPSDLSAFVEERVSSGRFPDAAEVVRAAVLLMQDATKAAEADGHEVANLRRLFAKLLAAKQERDFIIALAGRARLVPHPEAIMQMAAETLGKRLKASRAGFIRTLRNGMLEFGACWTDGSVSPLLGSFPPEVFGKDVCGVLASGGQIARDNRPNDVSAAKEGHFYASNAPAVVAIPLFRERQWQATFYVSDVEPRFWSTDERLLIKEVGELSWDAVERAQAIHALHVRIGRQLGELASAAAEVKSEREGRATAESQLSQLQKMEQIGQLTGGIAHDFNNMLAVVISGLNLAQRRIARGDNDVVRYIDSALDGAQRAANLTQRLLAFSRIQPLAPVALDANRLVLGMQDLLTRTLGEAIHLEFVTAAGLWTTKVDPTQLESSILNLAVNARDAMPKGGKLTVETVNIHVDEGYSERNDIDVGQYICVCVTDSGSGIPPAVLEKVFEPFFTTKGIGKGTGLGLSQVFGFVRQSHGTVKIYSEVGHGTTIKIYLPRFYGEVDAPVALGHGAGGELARGQATETILVVEDEERVRNFSVETLRDLGYTVIHAADGAQALKLINDGLHIALLFTDIVMPGITGRELADRAKEKSPDLRIIYTTGYTHNAVVHNGVLEHGVNFLAKPFRIEQLAAIVRRVLDVKSV